MRIKLKDAFELQIGKTPSRNKSEYWNGVYKWVSISDIGNSRKYVYSTRESITDKGIIDSGIKVIPKGTVIMSFKLSIGKTAITTEDMYTNEAIVAFIDKKKIPIDIDYLYYLCSGSNWMQGVNKAVMGLTLNKATLSEKEINIPNIEIQKKCAGNLDKIDRIIDLKKQQLDQLDLLVRSLFIEMFGNLGEDIFGDGLKLLKDVCQINPKKDNYIANIKDFLVSFVPMSAVSESGEIDTTIIKCYDEVKKGFTSFIEEDVLFAKITPCMENGKGAIAKKLKNSVGFGSTEFHVLRPLKDKSNSAWIYYLTSFSHFRKEAEIKMTGSAGQRRVPASFLENYKIALPPLELQNKFANFVRGTDKSKLAVKKSLEELEILKKSLMQKYFA